ncbi:hypothetical protein LMIY3S_00565 [Labrys miyagiensis]
MTQHLGAIALVVRSYDEAKAWYRDVLGFQVVQDVDMGGGRRWLTVAPPGARETTLLLAQAAGPQQAESIGNQTGGRVFLFLHTDDFWRDYRLYRSRGVRFCEEPREEAYGTVAVFEDLHGNRWDLLQPRPASP